jgi:hypothetical protein
MSIILPYIVMAGIIGHMVVQNMRDRSVKGSHQRYVYSTVRIIVHYSTIALSFVNGISAILRQDWVTAFPAFAVCVICALTESMSRKNDDDSWFNGRWNKIKNGVKNFVAVTRLQPSASPSVG